MSVVNHELLGVLVRLLLHVLVALVDLGFCQDRYAALEEGGVQPERALQ